MKTRVLSIGEAMVEMAPVAQEDQYKLGFAGDTLNTAWYLKQVRPDFDVQFFSRVGTDSLSDKLIAFLNQQGIETTYIGRSATRTVGLYLITLKDGERSFSYWRGQSAARELATSRASLLKALDEVQIAYLSGITLAILDPDGRETLLSALAQARSQGTLVAFDPNLRPLLWNDQTTMCDAITQAAAISDIVLPSHEDETTFFGDANPEATLDRYLQADARTVVVKNGGGEILYSHGGTQGAYEPAPISNVVDTTAAGDSFNAGFLADFESEGEIDACVVTASKLAGAVIQGRGALVQIAVDG